MTSLSQGWKEFQEDVDLHDVVSKKLFYSGASFIASEVLVMLNRGDTPQQIEEQMRKLFVEGIHVLNAD